MKLSRFIQLLLARKYLIALLWFVTVTTAGVVSLLIPKSYTASSAVLVDFKGSDPITGIMFPIQLMPGYLATQVDIITSHNVALRVVDSLKLAEDPENIEKYNKATKGLGDIRHWLADQLLESIEAKPARDSSVIRIACTARDPELAANLANTFARTYIQTNLELKVEPARNQALWFDAQINNLRLALEDAQKALSDYQQETGIISLDEKLDVENSRLAELSSQLVAAQDRTFEAMARLRQAKSASDQGKLAEAPEILSNPVIQGLKTELARAEARFAEVSDRLGVRHPQYGQARAEVDSLRGQISREMQRASGSFYNAASETKQREEKLEIALEQQKARVLEVKQQRDHLSLLQGTVGRAQRAYESATQRADQIRLESQRSQTEIALLNVAVPPLRHAKPRLLLNLAVAMLVGLLLGVGAAILTELLERPIRCPDDILDSLELPVLALLPAQAGRKALPDTRYKLLP